MAKRTEGQRSTKEIDEALDKGLKRFLVNTQSKLSHASPVDTGRLASSWMIGKGVLIVTLLHHEEYSEPTIKQYSGDITLDSEWWINSLDCARACGP